MNVKGFITPTASTAHPWNGLTLSDILGGWESTPNSHGNTMYRPRPGLTLSLSWGVRINTNLTLKHHVSAEAGAYIVLILGGENQHQTHMETPCIGQGRGLHCPCLVKKRHWDPARAPVAHWWEHLTWIQRTQVRILAGSQCLFSPSCNSANKNTFQLSLFVSMLRHAHQSGHLIREVPRMI